jgi:photosystem II stability/assembly factor-like uncharacterized protein
MLTYLLPADAQWTNTVTDSDAYFKIRFTSANTGYVLKNAGVNTQLLKTVDAAGNWIPCTNITNHTIHDFHFITDDIGWVCTDSGGVSSNNIHVFKTINGGNTWNKISVITGVQAISPKIYFTDGAYGTLTETYGNIWRTTNGGINWNSQVFGSEIFNDIEFTSPQTGYIGCWDGTFNYLGVLFKTTDSGSTWNIHHTFPNLQTAIDRISFIDDNTGYISTISYMIMRTTNGGTVWDTLGYFKNNGIDVEDIFFSSLNLGWAVDNYGNIYKTTDGAQTWTVDFPDDSVGISLNHIFVNGSTGYATGYNGHVLKNTNANSIGENNELPQSRIYPNPGNGLFHVLFNHNEKNRLQVYSSNGQMVMDVSDCKSGPLNLSYLQNGLYILSFITDNGYVNQHKLVIQK